MAAGKQEWSTRFWPWHCGLDATPCASVVTLSFVLTVLLAYLLGSIPTGYLVARARGMDIRDVGSGNIGATNVFRSMGRGAGVVVLAVDFLKGLLACGLVPPFLLMILGLKDGGVDDLVESMALAAAVAAILGHNYTCWLRFKGGKGIATSAGVLTALVPWALLIILIVWLVVFGLWRYVSLASIAASLALPPAVWATGGSVTLIGICTGLTGLAVYKHRSNVQRLIAGTEHRMNRRRKRVRS
jgi:acyl phosphate:glycerol-3-phosphate acyltransferase